MPDEASTPPADPPPQQATDGQSTQAPPPQSGDTVAGQASEPVTPPAVEPARAEPTPDPETARPEIAPLEAPPTDAPAVAGRQTESAPETPSGAVETSGGSENLKAVIDTPKNSELSTGQATPQNTPVATPEPPSSVPDSAEATTGKQDYGRAQQITREDTTPSQSPPSKGGEVRRGDPEEQQAVNGARLAVANAKIQEAKRKKLDKIMAALEGKGPTTLPPSRKATEGQRKLRRVNAITNDEVEKLLRVSDATATRYLQTLEQENRIKQTGKTGTAVFYEKM